MSDTTSSTAPASRGGRLSMAGKETFLAHMQEFLSAHTTGKWCVAAVDIEHFKLFNEWYGTQRGDVLLDNLAAAVVSCAARYGSTAGYFGNDDFFLLVPDDDAEIRSVQAALQACVAQHETKISFWVVMGLCAAPIDGADAPALCNYAQIAASTNTAGAGHLHRFEPALLDKMLERQRRLTELERALANDEFFFYLQPKCNNVTRAIVGMEALARWNHPTRGVVPPGEFIPMLEDTGLIARLDCYLWEQVCKMLNRWQSSGRNLVPISINVSIADIEAMDVPQVLAGLMEKYGLEPKLLPVEITESMLAENRSLMDEAIHSLHAKGFAVLMDDFGSGYSSLNTLKNVDIDLIKLDIKFLDINADNREKGVHILESIIELARKLRLPIVAEGVETQEQVTLLQSLDCLYSQGYYFFKPMPVQSAEALLDQPSTEQYWDVRCDLALRGTAAHSRHVSEQAVASLQAFQIYADSVLMLALLDLATGRQVIIKRDASLLSSNPENVGTFDAYTEWLVQKGAVCAEDVPVFVRQMNFESLRKQIYAGQSSVFCRFRERVGAQFAWLTMEIQPCRGCSEQNPFAVLTVRENTQANQLSQELVFNSTHDWLTKLYNRNQFELDLLQLAAEGFKSIACIYMDVIGLHEINNYLGHEAGDNMLCYTANALRDVFAVENLYRIGGDEFVVLLPECSLHEAWAGADKLREALKQKDYEISIGIHVTSDMDHLQKAINKAEAAMRKEKQLYYQRNGKTRQLRGLNEKLEQLLLEKHDTDSFLQVLAPRFKAVYVVNLGTDTMRSIYTSPYFEKMMESANGSYSKALRLYSEQMVAPEYRELFLQLCSYDYLRARLSAGKVIANIYRRTDGSDVYVMVLNYAFDAASKDETLWIFSDEALRAGDTPPAAQ